MDSMPSPPVRQSFGARVASHSTSSQYTSQVVFQRTTVDEDSNLSAGGFSVVRNTSLHSYTASASTTTTTLQPWAQELLSTGSRYEFVIRLEGAVVTSQKPNPPDEVAAWEGLSDGQLKDNAKALAAGVTQRLLHTDLSECPICMDDEVQDMVVTPCGHLLCKVCLPDHLKSGAGRSCPHCRASWDVTKFTDVSSLLSVHGSGFGSCKGDESDRSSSSGSGSEQVAPLVSEDPKWDEVMNKIAAQLHSIHL